MTSPRMARLSWAGEVFYRRLHSVVDDFGRFHAHPMLLRAACYPLQLDKVSDSDIGKWTRETAEAGLVRVYRAEDRNEYLEIADFRQQKRAMKSKFPEMSADEQHTHSTCVADAQQPPASAHLDGGERREAKAGDKAGRKRPIPLPDDFGLSENLTAWAEEKGFGSLEAHLEFFVGRMKASGKTYVDWEQAFMNCVREDWGHIRVPDRTNGAAPKAKPNCSACSKPITGAWTMGGHGPMHDACWGAR